MYLDRAVDSQGKTLEFFFSLTRDAKAAKRFFLKTLTASQSSKPRVINVEKNAAYPKAFRELKADGFLPEGCELSQVKVLNNLLTHAARFLKHLVTPTLALRPPPHTAPTTH